MDNRLKKIVAAVTLVSVILSGCSAGKSARPYDSYYSSNKASVDDYAGVAMYVDEEASMEYGDYDYEKPATAPESSENEDYIRENTGKKIIYSGYAYIQTIAFDDSMKAIKDVIEGYGGFIESANVRVYSNGMHYCDIMIRIPSRHFSEFMEGMGGFGEVTNSSQNREDVTKVYNDRSIEIESLTIQKERLMDMLRNAETTADMLAISDRLTTVETQLNKLNSSLANIDTDVAYSKVSITLNEVVEYTDPSQVRRTSTFLDRLMNAIADSWRGFLSFLEGALFFIIRALPIVLTIALAVFLVRKLLGALHINMKFGRKKRDKGTDKEKGEDDSDKAPELKE